LKPPDWPSPLRIDWVVRVLLAFLWASESPCQRRLVFVFLFPAVLRTIDPVTPPIFTATAGAVWLIILFATARDLLLDNYCAHNRTELDSAITEVGLPALANEERCKPADPEGCTEDEPLS